jgi:hypothetical protein
MKPNLDIVKPMKARILEYMGIEKGAMTVI